MSFWMVFPWGFHHHLAWEDPARHSRRDCANYGGWFQGMGSHPQVQPCCSLLWNCFPCWAGKLLGPAAECFHSRHGAGISSVVFKSLRWLFMCWTLLLHLLWRTMCWQQQQKSLATTSWHHRRTRSESCCLQSFPTSRAHSSWMSTWFWKHCIWTVCWWIWTCSCASTPKASLILFCGFRASFWFTCCSCLCVFCVLILDMMCVCLSHSKFFVGFMGPLVHVWHLDIFNRGDTSD